MTGTKLLISWTLLLVIALLLGSVYFPDTLLMSLTDTSPSYTIIRIVVALLLLSLLITKPPRSKLLRAVIGGWSVILAVVSVQSLFNYQLRFFDALVFLEIAIIFAIEALETRVTIPVDKKPSQQYKIPVATT
ncbi:TPA: hypothetical protein DCF80_02980 [Candidatus Saccharibacteria bacterium]|nr:hypothetical protein [Candidatus Saccharibacteria bacterium]HRK40503.1 hypothetical protein [Candidatus Saccharibacteria bacterium]